ncbi:type IV pili methyl-accepting chemotaxis transducer N-terminal domain-containing protein [Yoonia sp. F2084L]|nr:type IV pili methyl-accepting chemotaxis transducer N-terminal domain-containing protein [Yoonia sp. F2084L]
MVESFNGSIPGALLVALGFPGLSADMSFASPGETRIENGKIVLVQQLEIITDSGSSNRIVAAALLRTLSQEIPAAACHLHNGVNVEEAKAELSYSVAKFDAVALALLNGNEAMGIIGGETRFRTVAELEALMAEWVPIHDAAIAVLEDPTNRQPVDVIYDATDIMLEKTYHLLSEIEAEYSNPVELLQSDVLLIEVSGRMAAMTQRMAYEACRAWSGEGSEELIAELKKTIGIYEASMDALINGLPSLGVQPAPTAEIAESLTAADEDWSIIRGLLDRVIAADDLSVEERTDLYHRLVVKVHKVEEIEEMYQDYSKRIY